MDTMTRKPKRKSKKGPDRFAVLNAFVDFTMRDLTRNQIAVWMTLYRDTRNGTATVSQKFIAQRCGMSERTARRMVKQLEALELLVVVHRGSIRAGASTYRVLPMAKQRYDQLGKGTEPCPVNEDRALSG